MDDQLGHTACPPACHSMLGWTMDDPVGASFLVTLYCPVPILSVASMHRPFALVDLPLVVCCHDDDEEEDDYGDGGGDHGR